MSVFRPGPETQLHIGGSTYEFVPQRLLPGDTPEACMIEGQEGFIYVLRNVEYGNFWALKVQKPAYRSEQVVQVTEKLLQFQKSQGFYLSHRVCITRPECAELIATFPELEYALLMPWLSWKTWAGLIRSPEVMQTYTHENALDLARATVRILCELEQRGCTHTDISGANIMYSPDFKKVEILDLEGIYMPGIQQPKRLSYGSPGYQHRKPGRQGQWSEYGDRFAGAILLTEILTCWHPLLRAQMPADTISLFLPEELQVQGGIRWKIARDVLWSLTPALLDLFDRAWASSSLKKCPDFKQWLALLSAPDPQVGHPSPHTPFGDSSPFSGSF